jgi:hypothetical protein
VSVDRAGSVNLDLRSGGAGAARTGLALFAWVAAGFGLGLAAGFVASLLRGRPVAGSTGYVAPAPAFGHRAVPEIDLRGQRRAGAAPLAAGSRRTPVGASVSGGK